MSKLQMPIRVGALELAHRIVLAPLTRMRSEMPGNVPGAAMVEYYAQRATPGGLLIGEATFIHRQGDGGYASPGIKNDEQAADWRKVVEAVHAKGARMLLQLWHVGRVTHESLMPPGVQPVTPSLVKAELFALLEGGPGRTSPARAIELDEIPALIALYADAARRATGAGFDSVEIHAANGYLIDQFLQNGSNHRTNAYGALSRIALASCWRLSTRSRVSGVPTASASGSARATAQRHARQRRARALLVHCETAR